jgi:hypothetical protein
MGRRGQCACVVRLPLDGDMTSFGFAKVNVRLRASCGHPRAIVLQWSSVARRIALIPDSTSLQKRTAETPGAQRTGDV